MEAIAKASRAVITQYAAKTIRPIEIIAMVVFVVLFIGTVLLATMISQWWWLLMIVVLAYGLVGSILWLVIHFSLDKLRPDQTTSQKQAVAKFIESSEKIADTIGLTRFGLILRILQSVMSRKRDTLLVEFSADSKELKADFEQVIAAFKN